MSWLEKKKIATSRYDILIASHYGMCFGVKHSIEATEHLLTSKPATILGQLAHNPVVKSQLDRQGAYSGKLESTAAPTSEVVITAHGSSNKDCRRWHQVGYRVTDTTCPLVRVAHAKLARLVAAGFQPVIIGKGGHVEVRGLQGDFPNAKVILYPRDIDRIPHVKKIGLIAQTTQPIDHVRALVGEGQRQRPEVEVVYIDTVCHPTKDRQTALHDFCRKADLVLAIGGKNSNKTAQLARTARHLGCDAQHIEHPSEIQEEWLDDAKSIGLTAGISTLDESLDAVVEHLNQSLQIKRILSKSLQRRHLTDRPSPLFIRKPLIEVDIGRFRKT